MYDYRFYSAEKNVYKNIKINTYNKNFIHKKNEIKSYPRRKFNFFLILKSMFCINVGSSKKTVAEIIYIKWKVDWRNYRGLQGLSIHLYTFAFDNNIQLSIIGWNTIVMFMGANTICESLIKIYNVLNILKRNQNQITFHNQ